MIIAFVSFLDTRTWLHSVLGTWLHCGLVRVLGPGRLREVQAGLVTGEQELTGTPLHSCWGALRHSVSGI